MVYPRRSWSKAFHDRIVSRREAEERNRVYWAGVEVPPELIPAMHMAMAGDFPAAKRMFEYAVAEHSKGART